MKKQSGITIVSLIITIIVMLIIATIIIKVGTDTVEDVKDEDIITNMITIKSKAKIILDEYNFNEINNLVGTKYSEDTNFAKDKLASSVSGLTDEDKEKLYIWTNDDFANQGLNSITVDKENFYAVYYDDENLEIYYSQEINGRHSLTEINQARES